MALTIGIVGLPNVGKSTLFNALTKNDVLAANYPFATIEPNVGVVGVPDPRLGGPRRASSSSERQLPATVSFVDIAGIVRGASEGDGLGNKFLANIRESDAICQVIRAFNDPDVVHVDGAVSPKDDIETINTELILADLQTVEKALPRLQKEARIAQGPRRGPRGCARRRTRSSSAGTHVFASGLDRRAAARAAPAHHQAVPLRVQRRRGRAGRRAAQGRAARSRRPAEAIFLDAKIEADLAELDDEDALELLESIGLTESGLATLARVAFSTPWGCRPTSRPGRRSPAPGRSARAPPPPRQPA